MTYTVSGGALNSTQTNTEYTVSFWNSNHCASSYSFWPQRHLNDIKFHIPISRNYAANNLGRFCTCKQTVHNTHTHTRLTALSPGLPGWAGTRKVKPIWILLKQETVSGSGISWAICKSAPRSRQPCQHPNHSKFFTRRMPFLSPNQQRQSTEGQKQYITQQR